MGCPGTAAGSASLTALGHTSLPRFLPELSLPSGPQEALLDQGQLFCCGASHV